MWQPCQTIYLENPLATKEAPFPFISLCRLHFQTEFEVQKYLINSKKLAVSCHSIYEAKNVLQSYRGILYYAVTRRTESFDDILWKHGILTRLKLCKDFLLLWVSFFCPAKIQFVYFLPSCSGPFLLGLINQRAGFKLFSSSSQNLNLCAICRITQVQTQTIAHALNCFMNSEAEWQRN